MLLEKIAKVKEINEMLVEAKKIKFQSTNAIQLAKYTQEKIPGICQVLLASQIVNQAFADTIQMPYLRDWETKLEALIPGIQADSSKDISRLLNEISAEISKYSEEWRKFSRNHSKETTNFMNVLNSVFKKSEYVELKQQIESIGNLWPVSQVNIDQYQRKLVEAQSIIDSLKVTETVKKVLSKMASGQATLNDLTDEVMDWVRNNQLSSNLRISVIG